MRAVESGDKEGWLGLFADDAVIEDPIGASALDPEGRGHRGLEAIEAFWDANIAGRGFRFDIERSHAAGNEVANVGTITTEFDDGSRAVVSGVFTYRVDGGGRLTALRAFWNIDDDMEFLTSDA